jgi:hypothetical protein
MSFMHVIFIHMPAVGGLRHISHLCAHVCLHVYARMCRDILDLDFAGHLNRISSVGTEKAFQRFNPDAYTNGNVINNFLRG